MGTSSAHFSKLPLDEVHSTSLNPFEMTIFTNMHKLVSGHTYGYLIDQYPDEAREVNDPTSGPNSVMNPHHVTPEAHCTYAKKKKKNFSLEADKQDLVSLVFEKQDSEYSL
ncbi:uncharacterized protein ACDP82_007189 [Pangshura tecta]